MPQLSKREQKAIASHLPQISWKKRPSELRGYARTFYVNADNGDYIRIDYNLREKRVRIFLEDHEEGGIGYFSVIEKGTVVNEKNIATGRNSQLSARFSQRADILATLPHEVRSLIGNNYGVTRAFDQVKNVAKKETLEVTRRRYFRRDDGEGSPLLGEFHREKSLGWIDLRDLLVVWGGMIGLYVWQHEFRYLGAFAALFGLFIGFWDMFKRRREPIFSKVILLLLLGVSMYVYGYFFA